jgi:regulator of protease activity HflC (stomatin/prohibitin superfamily)
MPLALTISAVILVIILFNCIHVLYEYERAVVFTLGRYTGVKGPGLILVIPVLQQVVRVDLRTIVMGVAPQDVISRDNVSVRVSAVIYFRVVEPDRAVIQVENYEAAVDQFSQTTLRSVLGQHELDEMLAERTKLNSHIQEILDEHTSAWGIKVTMVEIKQIDINENMVRAIAKQAEAERERRAKVIHADGEYQAAQKLLEAAKIIAQQKEALQLRYLQTLSNIGEEKNTTIVFPLPIELLTSLMKKE